MKIVLIDGVDSHSGRGWQNVEQIERVAEPLYCRSVGWLVSEEHKCKVIVPHIGGEKNGEVFLQGCGDITIPIASILKIKVLQRK